MRDRRTLVHGLAFAAAHFTASLGFGFLHRAISSWNPSVYVSKALSALSMVLALPILFPSHDPSWSVAATITSMAANSAVAAAIFLLLRVALSQAPAEPTKRTLLAGIFLAIACGPASAEHTSESSVGIPARITDLVLPGTELEVLPSDAKTAVVLRITRVAPHGTDFRYDLEWTGLDVGPHDLRAFLRRKDGSDVSNLPEILVETRSVLAPGLVQPNHPRAGDVPRFGGYRVWMITLGIAWAIGLVAILFLFRKKRATEHGPTTRPRTLAERLRPLVESGMRGTLTSAERAQLELGLVAYWRRRLGLDAERPDEALAAMRRHADAGPLLNQLDAWLYKPDTSASVDVAALLAPYKDLPPDALETAAAGS